MTEHEYKVMAGYLDNGRYFVLKNGVLVADFVSPSIGAAALKALEIIGGFREIGVVSSFNVEFSDYADAATIVAICGPVMVATGQWVKA